MLYPTDKRSLLSADKMSGWGFAGDMVEITLTSREIVADEVQDGAPEVNDDRYASGISQPNARQMSVEGY